MAMRPKITCVSMDLTTHCDRRCPDCSAGIGINRVLQHHPWAYFERVAPFIQGIERVNLTGGEPTIHPHFAEYVARFKELFACNRLTLSTDGKGVVRYADIIREHIDEVHFSDYQSKPEALVRLAAMPLALSVYQAGAAAENFTRRSDRGSGKPCFRGESDTVAYADGKFFPCCVSPGLDGTKGVEPSPYWREEVLRVDMGCGVCMFSPAEAA